MGLEALKAYAVNQASKDFEDKPNQPLIEPENKTLTAHIERDKQTWEYSKKQAENILKSERLRCKIYKDVKAGADTYSLLIDAIKCISLMTGDTVFYDQNIKELREREH